MTLYSEIYDIFLGQITDYELIELIQDDFDLLKLNYLKNAVDLFTEYDGTLTLDDENEQFSAILTGLEKQIIAKRMVLQWIDIKVNNTDLFNVILTPKDFQAFSIANVLDKILKVKSTIRDDVDFLIIKYTYNNSLEDLR